MPSLDDVPLIARLTQLPNGAGVLIGEPVPAADTGATMTDFGAGCSRWLQLIVGGQGELDRCPLWTTVNYLPKELKRTNLRLELSHAGAVVRVTGVTHLALGEIRSTGETVTLTYRLYEVPAKKPVAPPVTISDTPERVITQLPRLARELAVACGATDPVIPTALGETVEELQMLGALPWLPGKKLDEAAQAQIRARAAVLRRGDDKQVRPGRPVLAAFLGMMLDSRTRSAALLNADVYHLSRALPQNTLVLAESTHHGFRAADPNTDEVRTRLDAELAKFPQNYLLRSGSAYHHLQRARLAEARPAAETAVRCSAGNPSAWMALAELISRQADQIRRARYIDKLTPEELEACGQFYAEWLPVAMKTVALDEQSVDAWLALSSAAMFLGVEQIADNAFDKAHKLDPSDSQVIWWGLELYQPKWIGDPEKLRQVAQAAVAAADRWHPDDRVNIAVALRRAGFKELWNEVTKTDSERTRVEAYFTDPVR